MRAPFRLTPEAESQLGDILEFIAADNERAAERVRDALYDAIAILAQTPEIGHRREDLTARPLKFWSVYSYLVVYDPSSVPRTVVAIVHAARDVAAVLSDRDERR